MGAPPTRSDRRRAGRFPALQRITLSPRQNPPMTTSPVHRTIDAVWRIESAKIIATVARMVRDVGVAEELAQDALITALEQWPAKGVPDKPAAWLMATAKNRALDWLRRGQLIERKHEEL